MSKNSLYRDLTAFGSQYPLHYKMKDSEKFIEWTEEKFEYVKYNPRKPVNRYGLSITSLDGGLSGIPDLDSLIEYNIEHQTNYTERDFATPTPVLEWPSLKNILKPFEGHIFRTHVLKLGWGGFFPPHRDHPDTSLWDNSSRDPETKCWVGEPNKVSLDTFRLIMPLKNCDTPNMNFVLEEKILHWRQGVLYFVDTARMHYLFNTSVNPSYWLVVNVDVNDSTLANVLRNIDA